MAPADTNSPQVYIRHGRRFHGTESNYGLPNDDEEHMRLDYQHEAIKLILVDCLIIIVWYTTNKEAPPGSNYTAPLPQMNASTGPKDILDVCSESGAWVVEIAQEFPTARVVGVDMSDPRLSASPPQNVSFMIADITRPFPFDTQSFDVVQMRIVPSIHERTMIYQEIHRVLRPGGLIQLVELDNHVSRVGLHPPAMDECNRAINLGGHKNRSSQSQGEHAPVDSKQEGWSMANRVAQGLRNTPELWGNVHEEIVTVPVGVWTDDETSRKAGRLAQNCAVELMRGFRPNLIDNAMLTEDEVDAMITKLADELEDGAKWQLETPYHFVWAIKTD